MILELAGQDGRSSSQGHHDRRQDRQLVVDVPALVDVAALERDLEAAAAHACVVVGRDALDAIAATRRHIYRTRLRTERHRVRLDGVTRRRVVLE
jgi:hypothetical protein